MSSVSCSLGILRVEMLALETNTKEPEPEPEPVPRPWRRQPEERGTALTGNETVIYGFI